jgi:tetratricopeptide (TPR) repeat protein
VLIVAPRTHALLSCLLLLQATPALAGSLPGDLDQARRLAASGDHRGAEAAYDELLRRQPGSGEARLGRAYARSHQRSFAAAEQDFRAVLEAEPRSLPALLGLGYNLAWAGRQDEAEQLFRRALEISPGEPDAEKGLAFTALWRGQAPEAARRFELAARHQPDSAELQAELGQALRAAGRREEAGRAFTRALELDSGRADARQGLLALQPRAPGFDLTLLGSLTAVGGLRETGLRFAEVAFRPGEATRAWLQYDDSLSLDNQGLAQAGRRVPAFWAGGLHRYGEVHTTRLEAGYRRLDGPVDQGMVRGEQVLELDGARFLKAGGWVGPRSDQRLELVGWLGSSLPLTAWLRLEPSIFYGKGAAAGEHDLRALLAAQVEAPRGLALSGGVGTGHAFRAAPASDGTPVGAFLSASLPVSRAFRAQALASREWPASGPAATVLALGFTTTLGGQP